MRHVCSTPLEVTSHEVFCSLQPRASRPSSVRRFPSVDCIQARVRLLARVVCRALAFSPNGDAFASGADDSSIRIWEWAKDTKDAKEAGAGASTDEKQVRLDNFDAVRALTFAWRCRMARSHNDSADQICVLCLSFPRRFLPLALLDSFVVTFNPHIPHFAVPVRQIRRRAPARAHTQQSADTSCGMTICTSVEWNERTRVIGEAKSTRKRSSENER